MSATKIPCPSRRDPLRVLRTTLASFRGTLAFAALATLATLPAAAFQPPTAAQQSATHLERAVLFPARDVLPELDSAVTLAPGGNAYRGTGAFATVIGGTWEGRWDRRSGRPNLIQGSGVPLLPGRGNSLANADLGLPRDATVSLEVVAAQLQRFIDAQHELLQTDGLEFRFNAAASYGFGSGDTHWFMRFDQYHEGERVDEAYLFFRIAHGNIVQFGSERVAPVSLAVKPALERDAAFAAAFAKIPFRAGATLRQVSNPGELLIVPILPAGEEPGTGFAGAAGGGYAHVLAWRFRFDLEADPGSYEVLMDARTNTLLQVLDRTAWAQATATAGIYPNTNTDPEVVVPLPFLAITNNGPKVTDAEGNYDYGGGTATSSLDGKYFRMNDNCGGISLANSTDGNLNFGTSGGTDCTTPAVGGAGNTHASRTGFYHLTMINQIARTWLPSNTWLNSKVTANMNVNNVCNASWNGSSFNFYKSGYDGPVFCSNTGEIAGVFLHEWGHGVDSNTGTGSANDMGSGEAVGDTFAFIYTGDSCIGPNFAPGGETCHNCNTGCTGVRDVSSFSMDRPAGNVIARPDTVADPNGIDAGRLACPYYSGGFYPYQGPMGYEGHNESLIASSATWDLLGALEDEFGPEDGIEEMQRIWYGSIGAMKGAYRLVSGGQCNPAAVVDGCGATNWYTVFLATDDDDGNLANGTPNACRIWDAFDAHGIACGVRPACTSFGGPGFRLELDTPSLQMCAPASADLGIQVVSQNGFTTPVQLAFTGAPTGLFGVFANNPVAPDSATSLTLSADATLAAGSYTLGIDGTAAGADPRSVAFALEVSTTIPGSTLPLGPADGAVDQPLTPTLSWTEVPPAVGYEVQLATDPGFANIVASATTSDTSWSPPGTLGVMTTYYWRVRAVNGCGDSAWSAVSSFTTGQPFPQPYCPVTYSYSIEPITRVVISGIDNASSPTVNGSPAHEDFLGVPGGEVEPGQSYDLRVEGNTAGTYTTYITAWVDWDRNGQFDAAEKLSVGSIYNSTGTDGEHATKALEVPKWVTPGPLRLRVVKKYNSEGAACNTDGWGQAEDYTLVVPSDAVYTVGGTATGIPASGVFASLNGGESISITADGPYVFPEVLADGDAWEVQVSTRAALVCTVEPAAGTIAGADVTDADITCVDPHDLIFADGFDTNEEPAARTR